MLTEVPRRRGSATTRPGNDGTVSTSQPAPIASDMRWLLDVEACQTTYSFEGWVADLNVLVERTHAQV